MVLALPSLDVVEVTEAACRARFPYIPGLAVDLVLTTTRRFRIPEPLRLAHQASTALRRRLDGQ